VEKVRISIRKKNGQWVLYDVDESLLSDSGVTHQHFDKQIWPLKLSPDLLNIAKTDPDEMTLVDLHHYLKFQRKNNLNAGAYAIEFWQRIMQPLAILVMVFLGSILVFGPLRTATLGLRLVGGVGIGFAFYLLDKMMAPLSIYWQIPAVFAAAIPIVVFSLLGFGMLKLMR